MDPISMAIFAGGTIMSLLSANDEKQRQQELSRETLKIDSERSKLTKQTNELQATRATRDAIRRAQVSRGMVANFSANSGAMGSSGFFGGIGQVEGQKNLTTSAISNDLLTANQMIDLNLRQSRLTGESVMQGVENQFMGQLGGVLASNAGRLSSMGTQMFGTRGDVGMGSWAPTISL